VIPKIVSFPVSIAQSLVTGAVRGGIGTVTSLAGKLLPHPGGHDDAQASAPTVSTEPVTQPSSPAPEDVAPATPTPAPAAPAKKAPAKKATAPAQKAPAVKAPAKKAPAKKAAPAAPAAAAPEAAAPTPAPASTPIPTPDEVAARSKPAAVLNEDLAPVDDDPVVYSTGPE
jgi:hypothetical protein